MPGPVDEEQRDRVGFTDTPPVDHLKHVAHGFSCALGTLQASLGEGSSLEQPQNITRVRRHPQIQFLAGCAGRGLTDSLRLHPTRNSGRPREGMPTARSSLGVGSSS